MSSGTHPENRTRTCECGNPKRKDYAACERCTFLDGKTDDRKDIIGLMREVGRVTIADVMRETRRDQRSVLLSMQRLERDGRVRMRQLDEAGTGPINHYELCT